MVRSRTISYLKGVLRLRAETSAGGRQRGEVEAKGCLGLASMTQKYSDESIAFRPLHCVHDFAFPQVDGLACIRARSDELMAFCKLALIVYRVFDPNLGTGFGMAPYNAPCLHYPVGKQII
jgi:hypothetical protein